MTTRSARRRAAAHTVLTAAAATALLIAVSACSPPSSSSARSSSSSTTAKTKTKAKGKAKGKAKNKATLAGTVTVFAAASLQKSFTALGKEFEAAHPGTKVGFNFGGSDSLAAGIASGAPADVFAAASDRTMRTVTDAEDAVGTPATFVRNQLEIATPPGNPERIGTLKDLTRSGLKVALCAKTVPCGAAAQKALDASGLRLTPVTYEQDVRSALTKVELKEVDASVVYRTDVKAAGGKVDGVEFPESAKAINDYPIVLLKNAPNAAAAKAFIALVTSAEGQRILTGDGFLTP